MSIFAAYRISWEIAQIRIKNIIKIMNCVKKLNYACWGGTGYENKECTV